MPVAALQFHQVTARIELTVVDSALDPVDLSPATTKQIIFRKPSGETLTKAASFGSDGTDGVLYVTTLKEELDEAGPWTFQAYIVTPLSTFHSAPGGFQVRHNLGTLIVYVTSAVTAAATPTLAARVDWSVAASVSGACTPTFALTLTEGALLTESGDSLLTESGDDILIE